MTDHGIESLSDIQDEVSLPTNSLTKGQEYAIKSYIFDGWGTPLRFMKRDHVISVISAGPDLEFFTDDDLETGLDLSRNSYIHEQGIPNFYVQKRGWNINIYYHRWHLHSNMNYSLNKAQTFTGNRKFDLFNSAAKINGDLNHLVKSIKKEYTDFEKEEKSYPLLWYSMTLGYKSLRDKFDTVDEYYEFLSGQTRAEWESMY